MRTLAVVLAATLVVGSGSVGAQTAASGEVELLRKQCVSDDSLKVDRLPVIAACTRLIASETALDRRANAYLWRGYARYHRDEYDLALKDFVASSDAKPDLALAWAWQGATLVAKRQFADAIAPLNRSLALVPGGTGGLLYRAIAFAGLGQTERALADLDAGIVRTPDSVYAHYARSVIRRRMGDARGAVEDWDFALKKDADIPTKMARFFPLPK